MTEPLLTVRDLAARLKCGRDTAYQLVASGAISSVRISDRLIRIRPQALNAFLDSQEHSGGDVFEH